jgi:Mg2+-importing ATPase
MVALVIRTQHRFYESRPSKALLIPSLLVAVLALVIPFLPGQTMLGFVPLPGSHLLLIVILVLLYVGLVEISKRRIYRLKKNSFKPLAAM